MHPLLTIAVRAVRKAGQFMVQAYEQRTAPDNPSLSFPGDSLPVSRALAQIMVAVIQRSYPHHTIVNTLGEQIGSGSEIQWLIKPLAGRTNFSKRWPHCALAITVSVKAIPEITVIYDPLRNELFTATRGSGAQSNGYRLRMDSSQAQSLSGCVLATCLSANQPPATTALLAPMLGQGVTVRCSGCTLLDFAYVAVGRMDGFFGREVGSSTLAAGTLLVSEAGGLVTDFSGSPYRAQANDVVAASPKLIKPLLQSIRDERSTHG